jgi:hypothetical protein
VKNPGRFAGLVYLLVSIPGVFALIYVPHKLIVHGNATATAVNIATNETLYRAGIACNVFCEILFVGVAFLLYDLFKNVNRRQALFMFWLIAISLPIAMLNELNAIAALLLVRGPAFLAVFDQPQREALAMLFLNLHSQGFGITSIFWGLWLFPLGLLVYRSGFLPRILGILLIANCLSYVVNSFTSLVLPVYADRVARWMTPLSFGELIFMLWILTMGTKPNRVTDPTAAAPAG